MKNSKHILVKGSAHVEIVTMRARKQFVELRDHNKKIVAPNFILQYAAIADLKSIQTLPKEHACSVGFTVTKKLGNAVRRNRIKRRFREIVRLCFPYLASADYAYVIIGRYNAAEIPFELLKEQVCDALRRAQKTFVT